MEEIYVIYEDDDCGYHYFYGFVSSEEEAEKFCEEHNKNLKWYEDKAKYKILRNINL